MKACSTSSAAILHSLLLLVPRVPRGHFRPSPLDGRSNGAVIGYRKRGLLRSARVVAVELKNELEQLKRGLDQMTTFADYAHVVYLACTPALGAAFLDSHAEGRGVRSWDPDLLTKKLNSFGFGLLLVEGRDVNEIVEPVARDVAKDKLAEVVASMAEMKPI